LFYSSNIIRILKLVHKTDMTCSTYEIKRNAYRIVDEKSRRKETTMKLWI
jgi:hypothetical protein